MPFNKKLVWRWGHVSATVTISHPDRMAVILFGGCKDGGLLSVEVAVVIFGEF